MKSFPGRIFEVKLTELFVEAEIEPETFQCERCEKSFLTSKEADYNFEFAGYICDPCLEDWEEEKRIQLEAEEMESLRLDPIAQKEVLADELYHAQF